MSLMIPKKNPQILGIYHHCRDPPPPTKQGRNHLNWIEDVRLSDVTPELNFTFIKFIIYTLTRSEQKDKQN